MRIPKALLRHQVKVERYAGESAYGPAYDPSNTLDAFVEERRRLVRDRSGDESVATATVYLAPDVDVPAESRITLPSGRITTVIQSLHHDPGGLPAPAHVELVCE